MARAMLHRFAVSPIVRALLWTAVILAPGGVALLPLLAADTLRSRKRPETPVLPLHAPGTTAVST